MENNAQNFDMKKELILRDTLAIERTHMANQRTLLAFVRTGLYLGITGLGILYLNDRPHCNWGAWALIILGVIVAVIGILNYKRMSRKIALKV